MKSNNHFDDKNNVLDNKRLDLLSGISDGQLFFYLVLGLVVFISIYYISAYIYFSWFNVDKQETVVLGHEQVIPNQKLQARILVRQLTSLKPINGARVSCKLRSESGQEKILGQFYTGIDGCVTNSMSVPDLAQGQYALIIHSSSRYGTDSVRCPVLVRKGDLAPRILLSTDKPIYQPGQTIHVRTIAVNEQPIRPITNQPVIFEIEDPSGTKVFRQSKTTSAFGIASVDFELADELNLGSYLIKVAFDYSNLPDSMKTAAAKSQVEVRRYELPKFRVDWSTVKPFYHLGETVSGTLKAEYFTGKPVANAAVQFKIQSLDNSLFEVALPPQKTDAAGNAGFSFNSSDRTLLGGLNGRRLSLAVVADVRDSAGHVQTTMRPVDIAENAIELAAYPETGMLIPGLENRLFVVACYPNGSPVRGKVTIDGKQYPCAPSGVTTISVHPTVATQQFNIHVVDENGRMAQTTTATNADTSHAPLIIRPNKSVYKPGETATVEFQTLRTCDWLFVDLLHGKQIIRTTSIQLTSQHGYFNIPITPDISGTVDIYCYIVNNNGNNLGCKRVVYVQPMSDLRITAQPAKQVYKPGESAKLLLNVTDYKGAPTPAALGVSITDESVFHAAGRQGSLEQWRGASDLSTSKGLPSGISRLFETGWMNNEIAQAICAHEIYRSMEEDTIQQSGLQLDIPRTRRASDQAGSDYYERSREDFAYASLIRQLENRDSVHPYGLFERTGVGKRWKMEYEKDRFFRNTFFPSVMVTLFVLLTLAPLFYCIGGLIKILKSQFNTNADSQGAIPMLAAISAVQNYLVGLLAFLSVPFYLALMIFHDSPYQWWPFWIEAAIVLGAFAMYSDWHWQKLRVTFPSETINSMVVFIGQHIVLRGALLFSLLPERNNDPIFTVIAIFGHVIGSLIALYMSNFHFSRVCENYNVQFLKARLTVVRWLVVVALIMILIGLLMPALANAKKKAQSISFMNELKMIQLNQVMNETENTKPSQPNKPQTEPRVRRYFPETLYWNPQLITDDKGKAELEIPMADSITTWRASVNGISKSGHMGDTTAPIRVFQPFFVDLDLPVTLSLNDEITVPVVCYNYLGQTQDIQVLAAAGDWFQSPLAGKTSSLSLAPNEVRSVLFPIKATKVGEHLLKVTANNSSQGDAIEKLVRVVPTGTRHQFATNVVLRNKLGYTFNLPTSAIPHSASFTAKLYPSMFSEVIEGMESILQEPYGCFEQTSSTTYPNVLVLRYLKEKGKLSPEIEKKARRLIGTGYQRLLTFEVPGGGFEWFGRRPANVSLTAYGLLEFNDMASVYPVDANLIERTSRWLEDRQQNDGSWGELDRRSADEQNTVLVTAYVCWALAESGRDSAALLKGLNYLKLHKQSLNTPYAQALAANAFLANNANDDFGQALLHGLMEKGIKKNQGELYWDGNQTGITYSTGKSLSVESTSLVVMAMIKKGGHPELVKRSLTWISRQKTPYGHWGNTQSTIMAIRALIVASSKSRSISMPTRIDCALNGKTIHTLHLTNDNEDLMHLFSLTRQVQTGENRLELTASSDREVACYIQAAYWTSEGMGNNNNDSQRITPLAIEVSYEPSTLTAYQAVMSNVKISSAQKAPHHMALVDLGIPPGFEPDMSAFQAMQKRGDIARYERQGMRIHLYLRQLEAAHPLEFGYTLIPRYAGRVMSPRSAVYEYYNPDVRAESATTWLTVQSK